MEELGVLLLGARFKKAHYGIARYEYELYKGLKGRGFEVVAYPAPHSGGPLRIMTYLLYRWYKVRRIMASGDIRINVIHATTPMDTFLLTSLRRTKLVVTYHDLLPIIGGRAEGISPRAKYTAEIFYKSGKYVDKIITISSQTKEEVIKYLSVPQDKVTVINLGVDERFKPLDGGATLGNVIGYVGSFNPRKRVHYLIWALYLLKK